MLLVQPVSNSCGRGEKGVTGFGCSGVLIKDEVWERVLVMADVPGLLVHCLSRNIILSCVWSM